MKTIREQFKVGDLAWVTHEERQYVGNVAHVTNYEIKIGATFFMAHNDSLLRTFRKLVDGEWIVIEEQKSDMERFDEATFTGKQIREAYDHDIINGSFEENVKSRQYLLARSLFNMMEEGS